MDQYEHIRTAYRVYGKKIREIARDTGHSKNTIKKALRGEFCGYTPRQSQGYPVLGPYLAIIDAWLQEDKTRPKKQRHTAHRVYTRFVEEHGFRGSEPTVRSYVRKAKARLGLTGQVAMIPLVPDVGQEAEVDWGTATAIINGVSRSIKYFCLRSKYSGKHFVRCYFCERQQAFFDAHVHAFEFFGGIFPILIYDNLTSAIRKVLRGRNREEQEAFVGFRAYHSFEARFCNPGQGHEKGGVEGLVGDVRRNYLVPVPQASTLAELNQRLLRQCVQYGNHQISGRDQSVKTLFAQEQAHLLRLPAERFRNVQTSSGKVNKYATVVVDRNHYSVPTQYVGFRLHVLVSIETVQLFYPHKELASHTRVYGNNKWVLKPQHYLEVLQQRPQAFASARPIKQWRPTWPPCLESLLSRFCETQGQNKGIKDFISVLLLYRDDPSQEIEAAVAVALQARISSSEGVKHLLLHAQPDATIEPLSQWASLPAPDVSMYGQLHAGTDLAADREGGEPLVPDTGHGQEVHDEDHC